MAELDSIAKKEGWITTNMVTTVLDKYIQDQEKINIYYQEIHGRE